MYMEGSMKEIFTKISLLFILCLIFKNSLLYAQTSQPTSNVLGRILMIQTKVGEKYERGTIFSIDVDGREYWITAKHVLTGAKHPPFGVIVEKSVSCEIRGEVAGVRETA